MTIACDSVFYILRYNKEAVAQFFASGAEPDEDGIESAFDTLQDIPER